MSEKELNMIADNADMIIAGYAYTLSDGNVKVLNLNDSREACILSEDGEMLSSNMSDVVLSLVQAYYAKNRQFMEKADA